jgi:hypothetical protein
MSITVDLAALGETLRDFDFAYLVTITDDSSAHVVAVSPTVRDDRVAVDGLGRRTLANAAVRSAVTLTWPPREAGGYSLIVDGTAVLDGEGITVTPSRAVLHRAAPERAPKEGDGCASDCIEVQLAGAS